jgi:hypothetical protein
LSSTLNLSLPTDDMAYGTDVWTAGYPFTDPRRVGDRLTFNLGARYLQGYVTQSFYYDAPDGSRIPSYELDMPTPGGLSGAPLVRVGSNKVYGVVYGTNDVHLTQQTARIDEVTGEAIPEVHRIVSFGLAHYTDSLRNLRGTATDGLPLAEFLRTHNLVNKL